MNSYSRRNKAFSVDLYARVDPLLYEKTLIECNATDTNTNLLYQSWNHIIASAG